MIGPKLWGGDPAALFLGGRRRRRPARVSPCQAPNRHGRPAERLPAPRPRRPGRLWVAPSPAVCGPRLVPRQVEADEARPPRRAAGPVYATTAGVTAGPSSV